jgi:hypothetical protein
MRKASSEYNKLMIGFEVFSDQKDFKVIEITENNGKVKLKTLNKSFLY